MVASRREVELPLSGPEGRAAGYLYLLVPRRRDPFERPYPLIDEREALDREQSLAPVQILEGEDYVYALKIDRELGGPVKANPPEILDPDAEDGLRGRLRPGLHTGQLGIEFRANDTLLGTVKLEVRSRKLDYLRHYRWMLRDIAESMSEIVMQRFAPTQERFAVDELLDARTLYQRFAFLKSLLESDVFDGAIQHILQRPYRTWTSESELRSPGQGIPTTSSVIRQIAGPGARTDSAHLEEAIGLGSVPRKIQVDRTEETRNNVPNRFVKFAFQRWRDVVSQVRDILRTRKRTAPVERGLRESGEVLDRMDEVLARELFRACGELSAFPAGNQVLHKREGYRDVFRAYIQFEAAAQLAWEGGEEVYSAGKRDVATLYEYWVFLKLGEEISGLCDVPFDFGELIEAADDGLTVGLKKGRRCILSGFVERLGRRLKVELWFNRTFSSVASRRDSWTRPMRPDCSVHIVPADSAAAFFHQEVWLHFDAKYRIENLKQAIGERPDTPQDEEEQLAEEEEAEARGKPKRTDLLKMHAYRDAIHHSSGSYVIYPGDRRELHRQYQEILPGLGAFALSPTQEASDPGASALRRFIDQVLDQVCLQTSQHERARYWIDESYSPSTTPQTRVEAAKFLKEPPADTLVLLGYVRGSKHHQWIKEHGLYNLRADHRTGSVALDADELQAELVLLYGRSEELPELWETGKSPRLFTGDELAQLGYPQPGGKQYFCLPLIEPLNFGPLEGFTNQLVREYHASQSGRRLGAPMVATWSEFLLNVTS